jgi:hypothetical protein
LALAPSQNAPLTGTCQETLPPGAKPP